MVQAGVGPCLPRFVRSSNVPEPPLPPASMPYSDHFSTFPPRDRLSSPYQPPPPQPYGPVPPVPSGMYAPVYDSRRIWRPQMYPRDDIIRSNSLPPMDVVHPSVYQTFLRERYNSLDSYYSMACQLSAEQRTVPLSRVGAMMVFEFLVLPCWGFWKILTYYWMYILKGRREGKPSHLFSQLTRNSNRVGCGSAADCLLACRRSKAQSLPSSVKSI